MYIAVLLYLIVFSIFAKEKKKSLYIASLLPLVLIVWIRYGVGTDYLSYNLIYDSFDASSLANVFKQGTEAGFAFMIFVSKNIFDNYHVFAGVLCTAMIAIYGSWIYNNSKNVYQSNLVFYAFFFIVWVLSAYRQGLVIAVGLYFLYNQKIELSKRNKVILILLLMTIHLSAVFFFVMLFLEKINLSKKAHLVITGSSIVLSIGVAKIAPMIITRIPVLNNNMYMKNLDGSWALFPAVIRIVIFLGFILMFDYFEDDSFTKKILNVHLITYPIYFLLKFSEIVAGRFFIYTFVFVVLLIPYIYEKEKDKFRKLLIGGVIILMSSAYLVKELNTYVVQSGYIGDHNFYTYQTQFNKDINQFYNRYGILVSYDQQMKKFVKESKENIGKNELMIDAPVVVKSKDTYYILDTNGEKIEGLEYTIEPIIYNDVIEVQVYNHGLLFTKYLDFNGEEVSEDHALTSKQDGVWRELSSSYRFQQYSEPKTHEIPEAARSFFNTSIEAAYMFHYEAEPNYFMLELSYLYREYYILLDADKELLVDMFFLKAPSFNRSGVAKLEMEEADVYIDKAGSVVWVDEK